LFPFEEVFFVIKKRSFFFLETIEREINLLVMKQTEEFSFYFISDRPSEEQEGVVDARKQFC
jgi:hypothetical protein